MWGIAQVFIRAPSRIRHIVPFQVLRKDKARVVARVPASVVVVVVTAVPVVAVGATEVADNIT